MKVLYFISSLGGGRGSDKYAVNYYKNMPKDVRADFMVLRKYDEEPLAEYLKERDCKIYYLPSFKKPLSFLIEMKNIIRSDKYDVFHSHISNFGAFAFYFAKKYNIPKRVLTIHASSVSENKYKAIITKPMMKMSVAYSNRHIAVSKTAGQSAYGNKPFELFYPAVELSEYDLNISSRDKVRKTHNIDENTFVFGTVGRVSLQKNPDFVLKIISEVLRLNQDSCFWWLGEGPLLEKSMASAKVLGIADKIKFFGCVESAEYFQGMDLFLLPSFYEGLPTTGVEAQISGLPIVTSKTVTNELAVTDDVYYLSLNDSPLIWAQKILSLKNSKRESHIADLQAAGFDVKTEAIKMYQYYLNS